MHRPEPTWNLPPVLVHAVGDTGEVHLTADAPRAVSHE